MKSEVDLKNKLDDLKEQILNLQPEIVSYKEKESNHETQIIQLSKKLKEELLSSKNNEQKYRKTEITYSYPTPLPKNSSQKIKKK